MLNKLKEHFLFFDGAMGTMLQKSGLKAGAAPEEFNITNPDIIYKIHQEYLSAGANIVTTNTFGANRLKLKHSSYGVEEVITAGIKLAKQAIEGRKDCYVALDIGPIGTLLSPLGPLSFEEAYDIFKEQVLVGVKAGAQIILIETMTDLYELKAAILAAKENANLPVFCTMTFQDNGRTFIGTDVATFVFVAQGLGVDVLGVNCSQGPKQLQPIVDDLIKYSSIPIMVQANAGLPKYHNNATYYDIDPNEYSHEINKMAEKGVAIFGGCCGTTPVYIESIIKALAELKPLEVTKKHFITTTSPSKTVFLEDETKIVGKSINPSNKMLKEALIDNDIDSVIDEVIEQENDSDILSINVCLSEINEKEVMEQLIPEIQSVVSLPLLIESSNANVIEAAARIYNGKPIIHLIDDKLESLETIFPIAKKYGALILAYSMNENGVPIDTKNSSRIIETAKTYGILKENILLDPLVLTKNKD